MNLGEDYLIYGLCKLLLTSLLSFYALMVCVHHAESLKPVRPYLNSSQVPKVLIRLVQKPHFYQLQKILTMLQVHKSLTGRTQVELIDI